MPYHTPQSRVWPGRSDGLLLDLPPLRRLHLSNLLCKTWLKTKHFLRDADPIFAIGAAAVTMTLFVPCIASLLMVMKERGKVAGFAMAMSVIAVALLVGSLFSLLLGLWT